MTKYGSQFSATDAYKKADGRSHNAALRRYTNVFALAAEGGTTEALKVCDLGAGSVIHEIIVDTDANLSTINLSFGTAAAAAKYSAAAAGPNATQQRRFPLLSLGVTPNLEREEVLMTPALALPGAGTIRVTVIASHR
jgi:hypothetical protein